MHSIFQIRISRNKKCAHKTGFPRPGHIYNYTIIPYRKILIISQITINNVHVMSSELNRCVVLPCTFIPSLVFILMCIHIPAVGLNYDK